MLYPFHLVFIPNIQSMEKFNNQELSAIKGGRREDDGGISIFGIGGVDDGIRHNGYIRIFTLKIPVPWW